MADEIQSLTVKVGITDDLFTKGVSSINKSMNLLKSEFKASSSALQNFGSDMDKLKNKQDFLTRSIELQEGKIQALKDAYDKSKSSTGEFSNATQTAGTKLNNAIAYMNKMQGELNGVNDELEKAKKDLNDSGSMWDKFKDKVSNATKGIGESIKNGIGLSIGHDLWNGFKEGSINVLTFGNNAQKAMNQFQASTGASNESMAGFKNTMTEIYNDNFGQNFEDIGNALGIVKQQWNGNASEVKGLTENALLLRDTFGYEVNESFRSANSLVKNFGISGKDAYNLIAQGAQSGLDKNGDLLDTMNEYPVEFKSLGLNAQDMFNMLQNGAKAGGFSIDKMGDAVKEFSIRAKDGSTTTQDAFSKLGLNVQATEQKFAKGGDTAKQAFQEVNTKLLGLKDPLLQNQLGVELWGTQWEDLQKTGVSALTNLNGSISTSKDALKDMNNIKYNDIGSAVEGLKRQFETGILNPIQAQILPKLNDFSNWFKQHMPEINQKINEVMAVAIPIVQQGLQLMGQAFIFVQQHADQFKLALQILVPAIGGLVIINKIATTINGFANAITGAKMAMDNMKIAGEFLSGGFSKVIEGAKNGATAFSNVASSIGSATLALAKNTLELGKQGIAWVATKIKLAATTIATGAQTTAQWLLNVAMAANPIGLVIIALTALGAGLVIAYKKSETFRNIINGAFNSVKETVMWVVNGIVQKWNEFWGFISNLGNSIKTFLVNTWDNIKTTVINTVTNLVTTIVNKWNDVTNFFRNLPSTMVTLGRNAFNSLKDGIWSVISGIGGWIKDKFSGFVNFFKNLPSDLLHVGQDMINSLKQGIANKINDVVNTAKDLGKKILDGIKNIFGIHSPSREMFKIGDYFIQGFVNGIKNNDMGSIIKGVFGDVTSIAKGALGKPLGFMLKPLMDSGAFQKIGSMIKGVMDKGMSFFSGNSGASGDVTSWLTTAMGITGTDMSYLPALQSIAMHESGGDPNSINLWDSNAKAGHPSQGLMQMIPETFNTYAMKGMNNILNPIDNAVSAIKYMIARYGSIANVPGVKNLASGKGYIGYATGTNYASSGWHWVGERGKELMRFRGGEQVIDHDTSMKLTQSNNNGGYVLNIQNLTLHGYDDVKKFARDLDNYRKDIEKGKGGK